MRGFLSIGALALAAAFATPASAQMCGGGQADGSSAMCGGMGATVAPGMEGNAAAMEGQTAQAKKSGCSCCQNMAMMMPKADDGSPPMMGMPKSAPAPQ